VIVAAVAYWVRQVAGAKGCVQQKLSFVFLLRIWVGPCDVYRMRMIEKTAVVLAAGLCFSMTGQMLLAKDATTRGQRTVEITYIANAGVLVKTESGSVLIDAFNVQGHPYYRRVPEDILQQITSAQPPFDDIKAVLITHWHTDHYDVPALTALLRSNPLTKLIASREVCEDFATYSDAYLALRDQVRPVWPGFGRTESRSLYNIDITVLGLRHRQKRFQELHNAGFVVKMDGIKILHVGDAEATTSNFKPVGLQHQDIDVAFLPYWHLIYTRFNRRVVREFIHPKRIFVLHIPPAEEEEIMRKLRELYPEATPLTTPGQKVIVSF